MLRFAKLSDAAAILAIYAPYVTNTAVSFETVVPSLPQFEARMRSILDRFPYLVFEESGRILGYAYASPFRSRAADGWSCELSVYLAPAAQGGGIGSALYQALLALLQAQGYRAVFGVVTHPNEPSAALHRKFGFVQAGLFRQAGYKQGVWLDVVYYEKLLNGAGPAEPPLLCAALPQTLTARLLQA